ncbi:nitroreductase family protein [Bifidobacterium sp. ESL0763]|uniref:nitroreductase family protein n=1 Tax=Bifidobacterium sp. ESL0763 TaxID=2983227 RepID=UPI0023F9E83B|nr:nitroreductase family protein [Bifidobacterium sp. ESL0763]MDF7663699.1 nitroreductase family protein [Bifidobacterium sp. ESL0763]
MSEHNQLIDMINIRTSTRNWSSTPLADEKARQLEASIDAIDTISGLRLQLVRDQPAVFADANTSGHFVNAADYIAVVGPKDDEEARERAGFFTERLVLTATSWGLATCWAGGSLDRDLAASHCRIKNDEAFYLAVVIGQHEHPETFVSKDYRTLASQAAGHRKSITAAQMTPGMDTEKRAKAPAWFTAGVEAALKAPSAMNAQPIRFSYSAADDTACATLDHDVEDGQAMNDLGIAKLHFQIGAGSGQWAWGEGGLFIHR